LPIHSCRWSVSSKSPASAAAANLLGSTSMQCMQRDSQVLINSGHLTPRSSQLGAVLLFIDLDRHSFLEDLWCHVPVCIQVFGGRCRVGTWYWLTRKWEV
jgi:hypothetical protein